MINDYYGLSSKFIYKDLSPLQNNIKQLNVNKNVSTF